MGAIIIGGGVGPLAGLALHRHIIENTLTDGTDQDHLEVHHYSRSADIPDRTAFLLGRGAENPAEGMARSFAAAAAAVDRLGIEAVAGIPCNTFHAEVIFGRLLELLRAAAPRIRVLHMLEETAAHLRGLSGRPRRVGLLSTTGTRRVGVYRALLEPSGFEVIEVSEADQEELHEAIYHRAWGLKAAVPASAPARDRIARFVRLLGDSGAEVAILGCTELPLALPGRDLEGLPLVDPMLVLARALIRETAPRKLRPTA